MESNWTIPPSSKNRRYFKWHGLLARVERCALTNTVNVTVTDCTCFISGNFLRRNRPLSREVRNFAEWLNSAIERFEKIKGKHLDKYEAKYGK